MLETEIPTQLKSVNTFQNILLSNYSREKNIVFNASTRTLDTSSDAKNELKKIVKRSLHENGKYFIGLEDLPPSDHRVLKQLVFNNHEEMTLSAQTIANRECLGRSTVQESLARLKDKGYIKSVEIKGVGAIKTLNYDKFEEMYFKPTYPEAGYGVPSGRTQSIKDIYKNRSNQIDHFLENTNSEGINQTDSVIERPKDKAKNLSSYDYIQWVKRVMAYQSSKNAPVELKERLSLLTACIPTKLAKKYGFKLYHFAEMAHLNEHRYETNAMIEEISKFLRNLEDGLLADIKNPPAYLMSIFNKYETYMSTERREEKKQIRIKKEQKKKQKELKVKEKNKIKLDPIQEVMVKEESILPEVNHFKEKYSISDDLNKLRELKKLEEEESFRKKIERKKWMEENLNISEIEEKEVFHDLKVDLFSIQKDKDAEKERFKKIYADFLKRRAEKEISN
jgi:hypothetical protein